MTRGLARAALLAAAVCVGCMSGTDPRLGEPGMDDAGAAGDTSTADATIPPDIESQDLALGDADASEPVDLGPLPELGFELGHDYENFQAWLADEELVVIAGPQGGYHTEHIARATGATRPQLHLALLWAEIWRDDVVLAQAGWEFYDEQWVEQAPGFVTYLPPLTFINDAPEAGPAELRATLELGDGRKAAYSLPVTLSEVVF